ncbi:hypothetical protein ACOMHN_001109 [Nucella lapillus]
MEEGPDSDIFLSAMDMDTADTTEGDTEAAYLTAEDGTSTAFKSAELKVVASTSTSSAFKSAELKVVASTSTSSDFQSFEELRGVASTSTQSASRSVEEELMEEGPDSDIFLSAMDMDTADTTEGDTEAAYLTAEDGTSTAFKSAELKVVASTSTSSAFKSAELKVVASTSTSSDFQSFEELRGVASTSTQSASRSVEEELMEEGPVSGSPPAQELMEEGPDSDIFLSAMDMDTADTTEGDTEAVYLTAEDGTSTAFKSAELKVVASTSTSSDFQSFEELRGVASTST